MRPNVMLKVSSLLSVILFTIHLAGDIVRGIEPGTSTNLTAILILVVWLYGALVLADRWLGRIIVLLGALLSLVVPVLHTRGAGVGGEFAKSSGAFLFIWTIFALGVTGAFSIELLGHALWRPRANGAASPSPRA